MFDNFILNIEHFVWNIFI